MLDREYKNPTRGLALLKQHLVEVSADFEQTVVDKGIDEWRKRLRAYARAKGQYTFAHAVKM